MSETLALVGSETLMGREIRDLLADNSLGADMRLIATAGDAVGVLSEHAGEPLVTSKLEPISLAGATAVILAGSAESTRAALELAPEAAAIDLTHAAEDNPKSRLRAPMVEPYDFRVAPDVIHSIAHPAAIAIALLLNRIGLENQLERGIVHIFEPASERGTVGIDELQEQTVSLLSFKPLPKKVFDQQLSFSLLAGFGEEAPLALEDVESRIERHLATLLQNANVTPMPSLRLLQAPVFHGYSFSVWVEFAGTPPGPETLEKQLASDDIDVRAAGSEPPNNISMAGQSGVAVGAITRDRNNPRAMWLWMVADNLRLAAQNAVLVAREVL